jgi:hypothetical protein
MAAKKTDEMVSLIAPNGLSVSVAESKVDERVATGYRCPGSPGPTGTRRSRSKK